MILQNVSFFKNSIIKNVINNPKNVVKEPQKKISSNSIVAKKTFFPTLYPPPKITNNRVHPK